jgi:hypothetical protein
MRLQPRTRTVAAWGLWLATMAACVAGLVVALLVSRPLTAQVLLDGGLFALCVPLGYATVGLVLTLRRPANPIGWLYAPRRSPGAWSSPSTHGCTSSGSPCPALLVPDGRLRSPRWRVVAATAVAGPIMFVVGAFLIPG